MSPVPYDGTTGGSALDPQFLFDAAHLIAQAAPYLAALVLVAGIAAVWVAVRRAGRVTEALSGRVTVEVVPASTFNPSEKEVGRWAHHLGRVRHAASGTPARGAGARLRYTVSDGQMRCYLEGPAHAAAVLAMPGFAEVEVRAAHAQQDVRPVQFRVPAQRDSGAK